MTTHEPIETTAVAVRAHEETAVNPYAEPMTAREMSAQVQVIQEVMRAVMKPGVHYGVIPGTGDKPTLLQPGAEKLMMTFRLEPNFTVETKVEQPDFIAFVVKCTLTSLRSGVTVASGIGSCSSRESKYAWRKVGRACPECGGDTIIKGRQEYGGGWLCFKKNGGCGAKFPDNDSRITKQESGRIPNPDLWDQHNTILKMAQKRAKVAAVLNATAASDIFTQDIEDGDDDDHGPSPSQRPSTSPRQSPSQPDDPPTERGPGDADLRADGAKAKMVARASPEQDEVHAAAQGCWEAVKQWAAEQGTEPQRLRYYLGTPKGLPDKVNPAAFRAWLDANPGLTFNELYERYTTGETEYLENAQLARQEEME